MENCKIKFSLIPKSLRGIEVKGAVGGEHDLGAATESSRPTVLDWQLMAHKLVRNLAWILITACLSVHLFLFARNSIYALIFLIQNTMPVVAGFSRRDIFSFRTLLFHPDQRSDHFFMVH